MHAALLLIMALMAAPASAQDWDYYANLRFGYQIDIPPGYVGLGESDNGDGQEFQRRRGAQRLVIWGGLLETGNESFEAEVNRLMQQAEAGAWHVTYQVTTPQWASFSAIKGARVHYQRMILLCDRQSYGSFSAEYSLRNLAEMDPIIDRLVGSLRGNCP
ncbi:hypothetical protein [uncultured Devosia sp.]|uniref:hypothetical protein n=1 Tax=uncultured Devosia sp. TaxID=211434 RepID=UPI0035CB14A3